MVRFQRKPVQWARIYRQTLTLIYKNFLIFYTSPVSTLVRALLFPLIATAILCSLKHIQNVSSRSSADTGFSDNTFRIRNLSTSMNELGKTKIAFVLNGTSSARVEPVVAGLKKLNGMENMNLVVVQKTEELFDQCKQSVVSRSECYAAVIFESLDDKNVIYTIAADDSTKDKKWGDWRSGGDGMDDFIYTLQWSLNSQIAGLDDSLRPSTRLFSGYFGPNQVNYGYESNFVDGGSKFWLSIVTNFVGPFFILVLIGVVYHEATFIAAERESSMSELMSSQEVTIVPRVISTMLSFSALYLPGMVFCSVIMTQVLFTQTSDGIMIVLTILAGLSFVTFSHFLGSFFNKANLAGLYSSTLVFALALISLYSTMKYDSPVEMLMPLGVLFPPFLWATLIEDIALRALSDKGFSVAEVPRKFDEYSGLPLSKTQFLTGSLYFIFFIVQIFGYALAAYLVERYLWSVKRTYDTIEASSDIAVRCTSLTKTYKAKRRWYWPFSKKTQSVLAVDKLDLEVKKGSVTFLLGPNGGGKTTTLKCIAGMTSMDAGSRLELNEDGVVFGICPQHNVIWPGLTVKQHINIWTKLKTAAQTTKLDDDDVIAECDLLDKINSPANTLSGGQIRKLQLAISFCGGSKVCCIDEASSGLDPLSRRSIWNIIQTGHSKRTVLVTTHFLDEADVLADHIAVIYKGQMVCEGPTTALKARYGDNYIIRNDALDGDDEDDDTMVWRTSNSAEATRKLLELEDLDNDNTYNVQFPTLEQVFLKVTSDTAIHGNGGDGYVGSMDTTTVIDEKIFALENEHATDIDLDVGNGTGFFRQIAALFNKRYMLLKQRSGWISYAINLAIPIIIAAVIAKFIRQFKDLNTCAMATEQFRHPVAEEGYSPTRPEPGYPVLTAWGVYTQYYSEQGSVVAYLGPESTWSSGTYSNVYLDTYLGQINVMEASSNSGSNTGTKDAVALRNSTLASRSFVSKLEDMTGAITNAPRSFNGFGVWAPPNAAATIFHSAYQGYTDRASSVTIMSLVTNALVNGNSTGTPRRFETKMNTFRSPYVSTNGFALPISGLIALAFVAAASIAIIYPAYERINHVRALHYCNGVRPGALWTGYLLFDTQFIIVESIVVWAAMFSGNVSRLYYESTYLLGVFILFGIATYLGTYLFSLFVKKAAFAIAAGVHIVLLVLYLISYLLVEQVGNKNTRHASYSALQYGFGLSSPAANLLRALWLAQNSWGILCGQFADNDISAPFVFERYGGVYLNLIIQILFLACCLGLYEYGSANFIRRITRRAVPNRLHYIVEAAPSNDNEKTAIASQATPSEEILKVSSISKYFGKDFAVENVSFNINANETLALLGGNGAGKTTTINMIRGELVPNFGDIFLNGTSVLRQPAKARLQMGVCPQDDAVDNLSVMQTLRFYATVKGLKNVEGNVEKVLTAMNISSYSDLLVKELSGGTKRKLSVAIALLGNPRLLLLDEPSTGQDAGAKRILWKALKNVSGNRAILLTTHSMEEASALATKVAIMGTKMLATGTLSSLQQRYGGAFVIRAVRAPNTDSATVEHEVKKRFEDGVKDYTDSHGQVTFSLPHVKSHLGSIMRTMEELKGEKMAEEVEEESDIGLSGSSRVGGASAAQAKKDTLVYFSDYTINGPTLEEVFMNVARESGIAGEA